jgi:hypothetical protein
MGKFAAWAKLPLNDLFEKTSEENYVPSQKTSKK